MPRYSPLRLTHDLRAWHQEELCRLLASSPSVDDCRNLVHDLLTPAEAVMLMRRFGIAALLLRGIDHRSIRKTTGAGMTTIQSVARALARGGEGYHAALTRLERIRGEIAGEVDSAVAALPHDSSERLRRRIRSYHALIAIADDAVKRAPYIAAASTRRASLKRQHRKPEP